MNKLSVNSRLSILLVLLLFTLGGCGLFGGRGYDDRGELVGVPDRDYTGMPVPYGMVPVPAGTFHMGQADQDVAATQINFNKQITIGGFFMDDTEITNNEFRQFVVRMEEDSLAGGNVTPGGLDRNTFMREFYPDTTVWVRDFSHHMGDPLMVYYFSHPAFDNFPVVGVDWKAANYFCLWRTAYLNDYRVNRGEWIMPNFRLPTEAEWEYASRGGRDMAKYPWGNPYIRNAKGCLLANFKPGRGNYFDDGYAYTAPVYSFFSNDYGLFEMSGNVSEWCLDAFHPASVPLVWDLNPQYIDPAEPRKIIRGGSWKDIAYFCETGTRAYEHEDKTRAYIGFRCAMTYLGRSSGQEF